MSQDLFAAFGPQSSEPPKGQSNAAVGGQSYSFFDDLSSNPNTASKANQNPPQTFGKAKPSAFHDDADQNLDEDWGDFESEVAQSAPKVTVPIASQRSRQPAPKAAISTASRSSKKSSSEAPAPAASQSRKRTPPKNVVPAAVQFSRWLDEEDDGFMDYEASKPVRPKTAKWDFTKPEPVKPEPVKWDFTKPEPVKRDPVPEARDPNVLFDADNEQLDDDDDDFGDFEEPSNEPIQPVPLMDDILGISTMSPTVIPQSIIPPKAPPPNSNSLLDLEDLTINDDSANPWNNTTTTVQVVPPIHGFGTLGPLSSPQHNTQPVPASPAQKVDSRIPTPQNIPQINKSKISKSILEKAPEPAESDGKWDDFDAWDEQETLDVVDIKSPSGPEIPPPLTTDLSTSTLNSPPTNIPPPALILSLFSPLFASAESSFFKPLRQESTQVQHAIYSDPAAISYLKGLLALATVCGRVIAGHKQRWKRDNILAQSMRIGPSAAGGVSGLKLTSIDKAENAKEEREAADALKAWQMQVGRVKSAIAEVKRLKGVNLGKIPELRETMPVKVAKEVEGGLKGNRQCALCGLKREERVGKVDFEVEDSFGEWWVEDVSMHRACRNFWEQHKDSLRQR